MKPTSKKHTPRKNASAKPKDSGLPSQLAKGRDFMKKYDDTFRTLAK